MHRGIIERFRRLLREIHTRYGVRKSDNLVEPAELLYAACILLAMEKEELEQLITTEREWERYKLLQLSVTGMFQEYMKGSQFSFADMRDAFAYDFPYINRITALAKSKDKDESLFSMEAYEEILDDVNLTEYNALTAMLTISISLFYKYCCGLGIMEYYLNCSKMQKKNIVKKTNLDSVIAMRKVLKDKIKDKVKGQDMAVDKFVEGFVRYKIRGKVPGKPAALYLFAGPPGTGKTYMAETFSQLVAEEGYVYKRFDMAAYGGKGGDNGISGLVGFEKTWKDAQPGQLTNFVRNHPKCILLFDEIEKAGPQVRMLFLSVLEGAVLTDRYYDQPVSFEDVIMIFTTNEGKDLYEDNREANLTAMSDSAVIEGLQASDFAPELVSRFMSGTVVMFNHLSYANMAEIFRASVEAAIAQICKSSIPFTFHYEEELSKLYLLNKGANIDARFVASNAKKLVENYFLQAMEYMSTQEIESLHELKRISVSVEVNEGAQEYFRRIHKPRILGCGGKSKEIYVEDYEKFKNCDPSTMKLKKLHQLADYDWQEPQNFKESLQACNWNSADRLERYDAILIDFGAESEKQGIKYTATEGYTCLKTAVEENPGIPIIVTDRESVDWCYDMDENVWLNYDRRDGALGMEEKFALRALGVTDFVRGASHKFAGCVSRNPDAKYNKKWKRWDLVLNQKELEDILERRHFLEMATKLSQKSQKLSADITYDYNREEGILKICFTNLHVEVAVEENAEFRQQNKKYLLAEKPQVRVKDIFGNQLAVEAVKRCIDNIRHPEKYKAAGAKLMKGILMYGAPGMGKTMFAKAMAYESGASFISTVGADFIKEDGITKMEEMFQTARRKKPCILFIDEFDAISENRGGSVPPYVKALLEKFLKEMDGLETDNDGVYVVGATNYSPDELDSAVMRRFSAKIQFTYPNMKERQEFLLHILKKKRLDNVLSERAAKTLSLMMYENMRSYAEIENFIEESIAEAVYKDRPVTAKFLFNRIHNETSGVARHEETGEKLVPTAFHEAGHAVLQWYFGSRNDYVTIVSRGNYGGYSMAKGNLYSGQDFLNQICICLAGRVAEMFYLNPAGDKDSMEAINIGASSDLQKATQVAYEYVCRYGLGDHFLVVPGKFAEQNGDYPERVLPEREKEAIWDAIKRILDEQWERTRQLLQAYWGEVGALAISLVYMKELDGELVEGIIQSKIPCIEESCFVDEDRDFAEGYPLGYPIFPHSEVKLQLDDTDAGEQGEKKYYYTVKKDTESLGIYEDIQTAFKNALYENACCRRFERAEVAQEYLEMLELKALRQGEEYFIGFKVDALEEMMGSYAQEKRVVEIRTEDIPGTRIAADKLNMSLPQYILEHMISEIWGECEDMYLVIRIYDKTLQQDLLRCMENNE